MRPSSPLLDSVRDQFEDYDQLAKDFTKMFLNAEPNSITNAAMFDVVFLVGQSKQKVFPNFIIIDQKNLIRFLFQQNNFRLDSSAFEQFLVSVAECFKKCFMEFKPDLDRLKFRLQSY